MKLSLNRMPSRTSISIAVVVGFLAAPYFATALGTPSSNKNLLAQRQKSPTNQLSAAPAVNEVYSWANEAHQKLPPLESWNKARPKTEADRRLVSLIRRGQGIVDRVIERGPSISAKEASSYDAQMRTVVAQMDRLTSGGTTSGDTSSCFKGCDNNYKGWGHGKGWNRFWCKTGCIKIKVGPVGVG